MNHRNNQTVYLARWIVPICRAPINGGYVRVVDGVIAEYGSIGKSDWNSADVIDWGDVAVLPRLVNAHTHLEFSDCDQPIGQSGIALAEWIGQVIGARGTRTEEQRRAAIAAGIAESVRCGVGLIGDIATTPSTYPSQPDAAIVSFAEVLGLSPSRSAERWTAAEEHAKSLAQSPSVAFGISPHAPYSTPVERIDRCVEWAQRNALALAMHVAESPDERELMEQGSGRFAESLQSAGLWQDGLFPWRHPAPIMDLIDRLAAAPRALLVHGNDLREDEIAKIARHDQLSVVYCPRTHHFFGYPKHPVGKLIDAGIRVALGTDSRASNPDLSLWKELQFLLNHRADLDPDTVLRMATTAGAEALLGAGSEFGKIVPGTRWIGTGGINAGGIESLVTCGTTATSVDQLWRDFAEQDLLCSGLPGGA